MDTPKHAAMRQAKALVSAGGTASLSVLDVDGGAPFATLVNFAAGGDLQPFLLISSLAHHSKCLAKDQRSCLMLHEPVSADGDPMLTFRMSLLGRFEIADRAAAEAAFLARHPYAELYAGFGDFSFWRMHVDHAHIIAGFGRAYGVRFSDIASL
jgi:heme iron utilization protein